MKKTYFLLTVLLTSTQAFSQAPLPFHYDGGRDSLPTGLTQSGLGTDYASSPHLKHDNTGDFLVLHYTGQADSLYFSIRYYGGSNDTLNGNFLLQFSDDGSTYNTVKLYGDTTGGVMLTNANTLNDTITGIPSGTQYIRWQYSHKETGNIGIGAIRLSPSSALPVRLVSFTGKARVNDNQLAWQTPEHEKNILGFVVQRSSEGIAFQDIGRVSYQQGQTSFQFIDADHLNPDNFYRLKIIDFNQQATFSPVVNINRNAASAIFSCYPNPVRSLLYIKSDGNNDPAVVSVTDLRGKVVQRQKVSFQNQSTASLNVSHLAAGVYQINIHRAAHNQHLQFIKR